MCKATTNFLRKSHSTVVEGACLTSTLEVKPTAARKPALKRKVSFNHDVRVQVHIHLNDMSDEEYDASWLNPDELALIRDECCKTVKLMNADKIQQADSVYCDRGLEYKTTRGARHRLEHKYAAWDAVEDEQNRQWNEGHIDEEHLAEVYLEIADESEQEAHLAALADAKYVEENERAAIESLMKSFSCSCNSSFCASSPKRSCLKWSPNNSMENVCGITLLS